MANQISDVLSYARTKAKTDSNGLTDADGISFASEAQRNMHMKLIAKRKDLMLQESYLTITSDEIVGGSSAGKWLYPTDMFLQKNIQVNLTDPTNVSLFATPTQVDMSNLPSGTTWEWLKVNQPTSRPLIDNHGDWFEIAPTPPTALASAIRLSYFLGPTDYAATTDFIQYPYTLNWRAIANEIIALFFESFQDQSNADIWHKRADAQLQFVIDMIGDGQQHQPKPGPLPVWNNGWDL